MTPSCERVLELLPRGALPPDLAEHARGCRECTANTEMFRMLGPPPASPPPGPPPRPMDPQMLRAASGLGRARPWWVEALLAIVILLATAGGALLAIGVRGYRGNPLMGWATAATLLVLIGVGTWSALSPRGRRLRMVTVGLAALAAILIVVGATGEGSDRPFWQAGVPCMATEMGATLPLLALLAWMLTRSSPSALKVLAAGMAAGATGVFALHLHCPVSTMSHLVVFHLLPWAVLATVAVIARRWMRTRSYAP